MSREEKNREELLEDKGYIAVRDQYFQGISKDEDIEITLEQFNQVFYQYWMYQKKDFEVLSLPGVGKDPQKLREFLETVQEPENKERHLDYLYSLLKPYYK